MKKKIEKIKLTPEEREEVNKILKAGPIKRTKVVIRKDGSSYDYTTTRPFTPEMAKKRLIQLYGGKCLCGFAWPDYKVTYDVGDSKQPAKRIQRYCQKCYDKWKSR